MYILLVDFVLPVLLWIVAVQYYKINKIWILFGPIIQGIIVYYIDSEIIKEKEIFTITNDAQTNFLILFFIINSVLFILISTPLIWVRKQISNKVKRNKELELKSKQDAGFFTFPTTNGAVEIYNPYRGILVVGGAGSGKSKTFIYPIIQQSALMNCTGVLYDFKSPELINYTKRQYQKSNVNVKTIDFKNINTSDRVNPIAYINNATEATNYAQALIYNLLPEYIEKQDFWSRSVLSLFAGAIWYFRKNKPELGTLPHIFSFLINSNANQIINILTEDREIKGYLSALSEAVDQKAEKQVAGVLGTLKNAIGLYNNPEIFWVLSKDETNLDVNNPNNPTMLLVGNNSKLSETYAPLISLIITVTSKLMNEPNKEKSIILIDEAPTIYLPNFEQIPATARSNKISVVVGSQDIAQMVDKYGDKKADVLISNLGNQFFGRTTNKETAERVVKMFGQKEDLENLKGSSGQGCLAIFLGIHIGRSKSQTIVKRDRIKIQEVTNFRPGQFASLIAEGNIKEYQGQFLIVSDENNTVKEEKKPVSQELINSNFDLIHDDIDDFIKSKKQNFGFN